jgi:hypothetical protein
MREAAPSKDTPREASGTVPTGFATHGPKTVPRVDYERIFVLDASNNLIGEYALNDECPLESSDLRRSIPVSGLRHLVSFYQGEYAFTPFKVDDLWFVILTRGVPRIEERGSVGTLLAAARIHIPPMIQPFLAKKEAELRARELELAVREADLGRREQRSGTVEADLRIATTRLAEHEAEILGQEASLSVVREYAVQMQRAFVLPKDSKAKEPGASVSVPPS